MDMTHPPSNYKEESWKESARERARQIWEHKEYDGDGYFPIDRKEAERRMVDYISWLLDRVVGEEREAMIKGIFSLQMYDPFGYGNGNVSVYDLERWAEKYGYDKEKILSLLAPSTDKGETNQNPNE